MKLVINGYAGIVSDIKSDAQSELAKCREEVALKKKQLQEEHAVRLREELSRITEEAQKRAEREFRTRVSRAKLEAKGAVLDEQEREVREFMQLIEKKFSSLGKKEKSDIISVLIARIQSQIQVERIIVPKDVSISLPNVKVESSLADFGVRAITKDSAAVEITAQTLMLEKESELIKLLAKEAGW